jgi:hypothetical protein
MEKGKKRVETIPADWVEEVRERVDRARSFREGVGDVFLANAELLVLEKKQRAKRPKKRTKRK